MKKGFTLIELLVVVLIIGILASVALPQYQKAVEKARLTEMRVQMDAVMKGQALYYLANGEYASSLDDLDIQITKSNNLEYSYMRLYDGSARLSITPLYSSGNKLGVACSWGESSSIYAPPSGKMVLVEATSSNTVALSSTKENCARVGGVFEEFSPTRGHCMLN